MVEGEYKITDLRNELGEKPDFSAGVLFGDADGFGLVENNRLSLRRMVLQLGTAAAVLYAGGGASPNRVDASEKPSTQIPLASATFPDGAEVQVDFTNTSINRCRVGEPVGFYSPPLNSVSPSSPSSCDVNVDLSTVSGLRIAGQEVECKGTSVNPSKPDNCKPKRDQRPGR